MKKQELDQLAEIINPISDVRFSMPRITFDGLISNGEQTFGIRAQGVDPAKEAKLSSLFLPIVKGDGFSMEPSADFVRIMLATGLASNLGVKPGETVTLLATAADGALNALDLIVAGIYSTSVPELDQRSVMIPVATAQALLRTEKVSKLVVILSDTERTEAVGKELKAKLNNFDLKTWSELAYFYHRVVSLYTNVFSVFGIILMGVVLLSAINSMTMNVTERVKEVGTFRAFGISSNQLVTSFVLEGAMIGALGGVLGLILGSGMAVAINLAQIPMPPPPGRNVSYFLSIMMRFDFSIALLLAMTVLGGFSAWLPGRRASKLPVVEAINHV